MKTFNRFIFMTVFAFSQIIGNAYALLIDDFTTGINFNPPFEFGVVANGVAGTTATGTNAGSMLGGSRQIDILKTGGTSSTTVMIEATSPTLQINNAATDSSETTLTYNGFSSDFTDAGASTGILIGLPNPVDQTMQVKITLSDGSNTSILDQTFSDGAVGNDYFVLFSDFIGGADYTALTSAVIMISDILDGGLDTSLNFIESTTFTSVSVPEPGTLLLLSIGLLMGFGSYKKKSVQ
ncbi:MAG: PEP-CTERM sorting domain-containing protein [Gammaproteobacteria bacterium]|nr:PEP-CTERM sorting domain-containing protein [Gammaproteobacteria bacterium]